MKKIVFIFLACSLSLLHAQETVEIARADLSTMYREAQRAEKNGNLDEAISIYKSILFIKDQQPIPYLKMANIYAADPNNAESVSLAIAFYQKYLELDPNSRNAATIHNQVTKLQTLMAEKKATEGWQEYSIDLTAVIQSDPEKTEDIIRTTVHPALKAETKEEIEKEVDDVMLADIYASRMLKAQSAKDSIAATKENQLLESDTNFTFFHIPRLPHLVADSSIINKRKATTRFILRAKAYEKENQLDSAIMCYYSVLYIDSSSFEYYKNIGYLWYKYAAETADTTKYDYAIESYTMYLLYKKKELKGIFKKTMDIKESTEYQNTCNDMQIIIQNKKALTEQFAAQTHLDIWNHYEGMWVAYWFSGDRMQPQWVFSIEKDTVKNLLCAKLHPASRSFSEDITEQIVYPDLLPDSTLCFKFIRKQSYRPLKSGYYVRHIFTEMSNPKYIAAIKRRPPNVADPQQWLWEQDEKTERAHKMIRERIENDYNKARQVDVIEEFFVKIIDPNVPHIIHVKCREIVGDPISDKKITVDTLDIDCYKVPDSLTFILLGRWNKRIVNHEHSKADLKTIGFTKWNNLSITGEVFKHVGIVSLFGASVGLTVATMGATAPTAITSLIYELYRGTMQFLPHYFDYLSKEENLRNPVKWNNRMLNLLLQYYDSEGKLNLKSTAKTEKLKRKEKRVFKKALKTNKQQEEAIEIANQN